MKYTCPNCFMSDYQKVRGGYLCNYCNNYETFDEYEERVSLEKQDEEENYKLNTLGVTNRYVSNPSLLLYLNGLGDKISLVEEEKYEKELNGLKEFISTTFMSKADIEEKYKKLTEERDKNLKQNILAELKAQLNQEQPVEINIKKPLSELFIDICDCTDFANDLYTALDWNFHNGIYLNVIDGFTAISDDLFETYVNEINDYTTSKNFSVKDNPLYHYNRGASTYQLRSVRTIQHNDKSYKNIDEYTFMKFYSYMRLNGHDVEFSYHTGKLCQKKWSEMNTIRHVVIKNMDVDAVASTKRLFEKKGMEVNISNKGKVQLVNASDTDRMRNYMIALRKPFIDSGVYVLGDSANG